VKTASLFSPIAAWGLFLGLLTAVMAVFTVTDPEPPWLLGGAAGVVLITAGVVAGLGVGRPALGAATVRDSSLATAWLGLSLALLALSAALGFWLTLIALGMSGVGLGALAREIRGEAGS
jgi:hypothetical protein